jgi:cephalosporin hydroxylase
MASSERSRLTEGHNARPTAVSRIEALDTSVFAIQPGHYSDRTSFLRVQRLVRTIQPDYAYLEVGSDLGGSLLPHLLDPACRVAVSVDPRPESQPDERGSDFHYAGNSTARMLAELGKHANAEELGKLVTLDTDAASIARTAVATRPHLVLIDAEHTNVAAFADFLSILPLVADDSMITFHDANLVGDTIQIIERFLAYMRTPYSMVILPSCVAVFAFGAFLQPVQTELAPHAEDTQHYFAIARQRRHEAVADAVIARTAGLPARGIAELVAWTADTRQRAASAAASLANMQDQLDAFTNSTSWRLTAPIRAAALLARRRRDP